MCPAYGNRHHPDMFAFAYQQNGERKYLDAFEFAWKVNAGHWLMGYYPTAMQMVYGPRSDRTPPAAVTDLTATVDGDAVTLTWTAPGDDGKTGTAALYQLKHAAKPILDFVPWPQKRETHVAFWGSENGSDEPTPGRAGTRETYRITGLEPGTHYVALKTRDERGNQSPISNVVSVDVPN